MLNFPGAGRGAGTTIEYPFLLRSFSTISRFFNFLTFFLKLSCGCDVFMFIVGGFQKNIVITIKCETRSSDIISTAS